MIPLCKPAITKKELKAVERVLRSGWLAHGPKNDEFEKMFARYIGVKHAVSMNSCTSALQLAIEAQGITGEVIMPSFTFVASANAIIAAGAKPIFVDIKYDTCNIDASKIESSISNNTQAIMVVHYGGQSCDMNPILNIAKKHKLAVIEDSAETLGGEYKGKKTGSFATACFSFFPTKNITTGEGGILTRNDDKLAEKVRVLVGHGILSTTFKREKQKKPWFRAATYAGYNYRMSNILATIGVEQLKRIDQLNNQRRKHATYLTKKLERISEIQPPVEKKFNKHVYQMYTIKVKKSVNRDQLVMRLRGVGIGASVHFDPPVHLQPFYKKLGYSKGKLPVTEQVANTIITLPMYPGLKIKELDYIANQIQRAIKGLKK
ncbi:DegT/DnrJ/EryC1/StrS family aminotransferase [bacterium]|nr:DegT/DnrJ/EryC1/StrS family aminotransferase [bacterium]